MKKYLFPIALLLLPLLMRAQQITGYQSNSAANHPSVTWIAKGLADSVTFEVFRAPHGSQQFEKINTWQDGMLRGDTLFLGMTDTTLTEKGIWQYHIRVALPDGNINFSEVMIAHNMGYLPTPRVVNLTTASVEGQKAIHLTWEIRNPETLINQTLYRSHKFEEGYEQLITLSAGAREYTDPVPRANEPWFYFILMHDFFGYQPPGVRVHGFSTYAEVPFPPQDFTATLDGDNVILHWRKVGDNIFNYRLYKRTNSSGPFSPVGAPFFIPGQNITTTDSITGETTALEYYCTSISDGYLESNPSDTILLLIPANAKVMPPQEVDYVSDARGVTLLWKVPEDGNVMGYNIYRSTEEEVFEKLNPAPVMINTFRDEGVNTTGPVIYLVESVNMAGKPSALRSRVLVEREPAEIKLVVSCMQVRNGLQLEWVPLEIQEIKSLQIHRQENDETPVLLTKIDNQKGTYTDSRATPGSTYIYIIMAEMNDGSLIMVNDGVIATRLQ
jgi:hypothetical protein